MFGTHFEAGVNYSNLYTGFNSRIPADFHKKITNINFVDANQVKNYDDFLDFLFKSPTITAITFENTDLNSEFLNRLPAACPALGQLIAKKSTLKTENDYRFLSDLTCLTSFYMESCTPPIFIELIESLSSFHLEPFTSAIFIELVESLFTRCRYFAVFSTTDGNLSARIERKNQKFELKIFNQDHQCKTLDETFRLLKRCIV